MMRRAALMGVLVAAVLAPTSPASAGGWTYDLGRFYTKRDTRLLRGDSVFGPDGEAVRVPRYSDVTFNLFLEMGLHQRLTFISDIVVFGRAKVFGIESTTYLGPYGAGLRYGILTEGPLVLAVQGNYAYAPPAIGDELLLEGDFESDDDELVPVVYRPAIENHQVDLRVQLARSFRLRKTPGWVSGDVGVRFNSGYDHALVGFFQVGITPWRFRFDLHLSLYEPFFRDIEVANVSGVGNTRYLGVGAGTAFAVTKRFGLTFDVDGAVYAQSNARTPAYRIGFEIRR